MKACPVTGTIHVNEPNEPMTSEESTDFKRKFFGESTSHKTAFECALIRNGVSYIKNSLGGIVINRDDMDIDLYGDMISGYDITGVGTATISLPAIK